MSSQEQKDYWKKTGEKYRHSPKAKTALLLRTAEKRAAKNKWDFNLTYEWLEERINKGVCELSGIPFIYKNEEQTTFFNPYVPSIDRIDSSKGYTEDNCRVIIAAVNMGIGEWGLDTYLAVALKVLERQKFV